MWIKVRLIAFKQSLIIVIYIPIDWKNIPAINFGLVWNLGRWAININAGSLTYFNTIMNGYTVIQHNDFVVHYIRTQSIFLIIKSNWKAFHLEESKY